MTKKKKLFIIIPVAIIALIFLISFLSSEEGLALAGCSLGCGTILAIFGGAIVLNVLFLAWVAKDAKNRGMDNPVLWMLLVVFIPFPLGLIIYLVSRPKGDIIECDNCKNKKLEYAKICPHCKHRAEAK